VGKKEKEKGKQVQCWLVLQGKETSLPWKKERENPLGKRGKRFLSSEGQEKKKEGGKKDIDYPPQNNGL